MPDLLIRNLPDDVKRDIERRANESGRSLSEQAKRLIAAALEAEKPKSGFGTMVRDSFSEGLVDDETHDQIWKTLEDTRKSDLGRDVPFRDAE